VLLFKCVDDNCCVESKKPFNALCKAYRTLGN
jgi:hypothetical protein